MKPKPKPATLSLHGFAPSVTLSTENRIISGKITVFEKPSTTQGVIIHAGALAPREPLSRVKLLRDHDKTDPVGFMLALRDEDTADFKVPEGENGDRALSEAANGLRDGLSIGFHATDYEFTADGNFHIYAAELYEVSLVTVPDFQDAQVISVAASVSTTHRKEQPAMNREQLAAALAAGQITKEEHDRQLSTLAAPVPAAPAAPAEPVPAQLSAAAPEPIPAGRPPATVTPRPYSTLSAAAQHVREAFNRGGGRMQEVSLALTDILPAADAGDAWLRDSWLGQVWKADTLDRDWVDAFGTPQQLNSMTLKGWAWDDKPEVAEYTGDKTAIPSGDVSTVPVSGTAERWAGGWDIDRIYLDLGEPGFLESFWTAAMASYKKKSNAKVATKVIAGATNKTPANTSVLAAITAAAADLRAIGASVNRIFLAPDLFEMFASLKSSEVPFWLANAVGGVSLRSGEATPADLQIKSNALMTAGKLIALDSRAATVYEKTPIQIQAYNIAQGGIDLGFFSYGGLVINDATAIVKRTVTIPAP